MSYAPWVSVAAVSATLVWASSALAWEVQAADERQPQQFEGVGITEHLGEQINLDLEFTNQEGRQVRLGDLVAEGQPMLLTLNYYECPSICTVQLNGLAEGLRDLDLDGDEFRVVTLSINPREDPHLASRKRDTYLELVGRDDVRWDFLVGGALPIQMLAQEVGFGYHYDPGTGQFAHQPAAYFISPDGTITRYLYGLDYNSQDLKFAFIEAGDGEVGSTIDRIILTCFHYVDGTYAPWAFGFMRLAGMFVMVVMAIFLVVMWRREHRRREAEAA